MAGLHNGILLGHKKEGNLTPVTAWMDLKSIMLSEINQSKKDKYFTIRFHLHVESNKQNKLTKKIETDSENRLIVIREEG